MGIAGVNSLLFAAYGLSKRIVSPFPQLSLKEIAAAGAMAGAANAILASPGWCLLYPHKVTKLRTASLSSGNVQGAHARAVWFQGR